MADFRVPPGMRPALELIATLSDDAIQELASLLQKNPRVLLSRASAIESARSMTMTSPDDAERLIETVVSLLFFRGSNERSTVDMIKDITTSLARADSGRSAFSPDQTAKLERNLEKVLELSPLVRHAKALSLATDCPALFSEARIISDIRPIFSDRVADAPPGAVIMHSLRISFAREGEEHQFFVYLDSNDLKHLQECIGRAIDKEKTLRSFLERTKTPVFETS